MSNVIINPYAFAPSGGGGGGTQPGAVPNLALWFDAHDIAVGNNQQFGTWVDRSGNLWNATQHAASGAGSRPTYVAAGIGGKPSARFGGSHLLQVQGAAPRQQLLAGRSGATAFLVSTATGAGALRFALHANGDRGDGVQIPLMWLGKVATNELRAAHRRRYTAASQTNLDRPGAYGGPNIITTRVDYSDQTGDAARLYSDGTLVASGALSGSETTSDTGALTSITIGASVTGSTVANHWTGDIAEIIIYQRALTDVERQGVEAYLAAKWGIAI